MRLIAVFEFIKGLCALIVAVGLFDLIKERKLKLLEEFVTHSHTPAFRRFLKFSVTKIEALSGHEAKLILIFGVLYAGLRIVEGVGLWSQVNWGRQIGIWSALLYLPFEVYEIVHEFSWMKIIVTLINVLVVIYLCMVKL